MKIRLHTLITLFALTLISNGTAIGQCTWHRQSYDGYEYTTIVPGLVAGTTIHNTPQSFAVHTGAKSLYMNFVNTLSPGTLVYQRTITVCPNVPIRLSSWITTSFSGTQCDMHFQIVDANNVVLSNTPSVFAAYAPLWTAYQSGSISPTTTNITFKMYSNVGGSQTGNDLSMDDFLVEQCNSLNLGADTIICNTQSLLLDPGIYSAYLWNNNAITQTLLASTSLPGASSSTYSVLVTDSNGCNFTDSIKVNFAICSSVTDLDGRNHFSVYPNPATDFITVTTTENISFISLFNIVGKKIKVFSNNNSNLFIGDVAKGFYYLRFETTTGHKVDRKILVE